MSDIETVWSEDHQRYYRKKYNYTTQKWEFLDWNATDNRIDSPTSAGAESSSWPESQHVNNLYTTPSTYSHQPQQYTYASTAQQGATGTIAQGTHSYGQPTLAAHAQYTATAASHPAASKYLTQTQSGMDRKLPRGRGPPINGNYYPGGQNLHYEELDYSFQVRSVNWFTEGKVFAVMWNETAGTTLKTPVDYETSRSLTEVKHKGNIVYTNLRRFIVVRRKREFCFACPIFTYSGHGTTKPGVRASEHAVVHSWNEPARVLQGETGITKPPVIVVMAQGERSLHIASRIYFGIHHPIQYNVKVKEIGYVPPEQVHTLIGSWQAENQGTNQASDVTVDAG